MGVALSDPTQALPIDAAHCTPLTDNVLCATTFTLTIALRFARPLKRLTFTSTSDLKVVPNPNGDGHRQWQPGGRGSGGVEDHRHSTVRVAAVREPLSDTARPLDASLVGAFVAPCGRAGVPEQRACTRV